MKSIQNGIWSGIFATGPMTLAMMKMQREMPEDKKSPLPPATLTNDFLNNMGMGNLSKERKEDFTMISHFGFGATCGLIYALGQSLIPKQGKEVSPLLTGALFGLGVWGVSYMVGNPILDVRAAAPKMPAQRNAMMILAHLVWGASLGYAESELRKRGDQTFDGERRAPQAE